MRPSKALAETQHWRKENKQLTQPWARHRATQKKEQHKLKAVRQQLAKTRELQERKRKKLEPTRPQEEQQERQRERSKEPEW